MGLRLRRRRRSGRLAVRPGPSVSEVSGVCYLAGRTLETSGASARRSGSGAMPPQLVYVHGAGPQKPASILKHDIDMRVFGKDMSTTRLAYYTNVGWLPSGGVAGPAITGKDLLC